MRKGIFAPLTFSGIPLISKNLFTLIFHIHLFYTTLALLGSYSFPVQGKFSKMVNNDLPRILHFLRFLLLMLNNSQWSALSSSPCRRNFWFCCCCCCCCYYMRKLNNCLTQSHLYELFI